MRWRETAVGTVRIRAGFLLLPKRIRGETRWLERAKWREVYVVSLKGADGWWAQEWVDE